MSTWGETITVSAKTSDELDAKQERVALLADETGKPIKVRPAFKLANNAPCICGSGRKWKNCCQRQHQEERVTVTMWPRGQNEPWLRVRRRNVGVLAVALMAFGHTKGGLT